MVAQANEGSVTVFATSRDYSKESLCRWTSTPPFDT